jgi:hypothetical protein
MGQLVCPRDFTIISSLLGEMQQLNRFRRAIRHKFNGTMKTYIL